MEVKSFKAIDVSTASFPVLCLLDSPVIQYKAYGTKALSANVTIDPSGTAKEGMIVLFDYRATITTTVAVSRFGDYSLTIFGTKLPYSFLAKKCKIFCEYHGAAWAVYILPSIDSIPAIKLEMIDPTILDDTTLAADGTTGIFKVKDAGVGATQLATNAVEEAKIKDKAATLAKMADLARGSIIVGGASDRPAALSGKTSAYILIGNGTDVISVPVSGDVTIAADGTVTIGAAKVLSAMIKSGELVAAHLSAAAAVAFTQMAALTASKVPVLNASGFIEAGTLDAANLTFLDVTAGTLTASKALVVSAAGKIDTLDITAPKFNGTSVTATAAEINFCAGGTSAFQTQIDAVAGKTEYTTISTNTIVTAATLKRSYILDTSTGTVDLTMPDASTVDANTVVEFICKGGNAATVIAHAGQSIEDQSGSEVASLACSGSGGGFKVVCDGVSVWKVLFYT